MMRWIRLMVAVAAALVVMGNISPGKSTTFQSVVSSTGTVGPAVFVSPQATPRPTPGPRDDGERKEARLERRQAERGLNDGVRMIPDRRP